MMQSITFGPDHKVHVLDEQPGEDQRHAVDEAVRFCPTHALSVVDD